MQPRLSVLSIVVLAGLDGCNVAFRVVNKKGTSIMSKGTFGHRSVLALGLVIATSLIACSPETGTPGTLGAAWVTRAKDAQPAFGRVTHDNKTARAASAIMPSYSYNDPDCDPDDPLNPFCTVHRG